MTPSRRARTSGVAVCTIAGLLALEANADNLSDYLALATGSFDSSRQAAQDGRYDTAIWHTSEIWQPKGDEPIGTRWTYSENWLEGMQAPYRQRITRYTLDKDGGIVAVSFPLPNPEAFVGAWNDTARFAALRPDALSDKGVCPAYLARTGPQRFEGGTRGQSCRNRYKGASYMVSRSLTDSDGVHNWDRGFNDRGEQVWGPEAGPYQFTRRSRQSTEKKKPES